MRGLTLAETSADRELGASSTGNADRPPTPVSIIIGFIIV
jgi:hypothetical protein